MAGKVMFLKPRGQSQDIIVPKETFVLAVSHLTAWSPEELKTKTLGEIEKKLNIKAKKPNNLWSIRRGKSRSSLYRFVEQEKKEKARDLITKILGE